ncbi:MAG: hypothetical protein HUN04_11765 [Desulfobacter sp.]|nr:MAG: hypothetical protein HUN04_11765 [Desulfobacter sp.]
MKKELIGPNNLDKFLGPEETVFRMGPDKILTPGAKDILRNRGVRIEYTKETCPAPAATDACGPDAQLRAIGSPDQVRSQTCMAMTIVDLLGREYGIQDPEVLKEITLAVMSKIDAN